MTTITITGLGFSIFSAIILCFAYLLFFKNLNKSWLAITSCISLLFTLTLLQLHHLDFLLNKSELFESGSYRFWLTMAPPMFYLFSRAILLPGVKNSPLLILHLTPLLLNFIPQYQIAIVLICVRSDPVSRWRCFFSVFLPLWLFWS